jgi:hypothetical protein
VAKLAVSRKESWETIFWLRLAIATDVVTKEQVYWVRRGAATEGDDHRRSQNRPKLELARRFITISAMIHLPSAISHQPSAISHDRNSPPCITKSAAVDLGANHAVAV